MFGGNVINAEDAEARPGVRASTGLDGRPFLASPDGRGRSRACKTRPPVGPGLAGLRASPGPVGAPARELLNLFSDFNERS